MNKNLGKGRSMDLLDPISMRMFPVLDCAYGDELCKTAVAVSKEDNNPLKKSIYVDSNWY
jgi:hypothetical protein